MNIRGVQSRMLAALVVLGLMAWGALALARPVRRSIAPAANSSETTWKLVNSKCSASQQPVGRACWDRGGNGDAQVNEGSATITDPNHNPPTYNAHYTYSVPDEVPPSGGVVHLAVTANDVSSGSGLDEQICQQSPFKLTVNSGTDPCAHAFAQTPGSSDSGSKNLTLLPSGVAPAQQCPNGGSQPECVTLTIEIGDGGNLYFTYQASPAPKISYRFSTRLVDLHDTSTSGMLTGHGSFQLGASLDGQGCAPGTNDHGSALLQIQKPNGIHNVHLGSFTAKEYCDQGAQGQIVRLVFRVTKSTTRCVSVGDRVAVALFDRSPKHRVVVHGLCGLHESSAHAAVQISSS